MMSVSGLTAYCSGLLHPVHSKQQFRIRRYNGSRFRKFSVDELASRWQIAQARIQYAHAQGFAASYISRDSDHHQSRLHEDLPGDPFWMTLIKESLWFVRSLFAFLIEQPSQLKYLEWPSFYSTLKTATLTLVLVALLIVALSSVDSVLCYLLALVLRRKPWFGDAIRRQTYISHYFTCNTQYIWWFGHDGGLCCFAIHHQQALIPTIGIAYMNLACSFCLRHCNLISWLTCFKVISSCFYPTFPRSSPPWNSF